MENGIKGFKIWATYRSTNNFHYIKKGLRGKFLSHVKSSAFDNFFNTDEPKIIIYLIMNTKCFSAS